MTETIVRGDHVRVKVNPATSVGGASGEVIALRKRSALVRWDGGDWADWVGVHRLAVLP